MSVRESSLAVAFIAALPGVALAGNMERVPDRLAYCAAAAKDGAYCYEWQLTADNSIRIVSSGYEDGGSFNVYRRSADGHYEHIAEVYPALREEGNSTTLYWGYTWDIHDVAVAVERDGIKFFGAFQHKIIDDGVSAPRTRQTPIPLLLFLGKSSQPGVQVANVPLRKLSIEALERNELDK